MNANESGAYEIVYFDISSPDSFDPLDADKTINIFRARTLFATPLEITHDNKLTSSVLDKFSYDPSTKEIIFRANGGAVYSDGSPLTVDDIAFAILRMAHSRPDFPVIKNILGLQAWINLANPWETYPSGFKVDGNRITIKLSKASRNPLFRFTLELFSIIPRKLVDPVTNRLTGQPPSSGYYKIKSTEANRTFFEKWKDPFPFHQLNGPKQFSFHYADLGAIKDPNFILPKNSFLFGHDFKVDSDGLEFLRDKLAFKYLPTSLFRTLLINPNVPPFDNVACRRKFAQELRTALQTFEHKNYTVSASLFPKILPGYREDLEAKNALLTDGNCSWTGVPVPWAAVANNGTAFDDTVIEKVFTNMNPGLSARFLVPSKKEQLNCFLTNKSAFYFFGSGFWAQDILGDLQMVFTPNLHEPLRFGNKSIKLIESLRKLEDIGEAELDEKLADFNLLINREGLVNPVLHTRRFYAANNAAMIRELPQSISAPAVWQIINIDEK